MELNKVYALSPETMMALEDPRHELVAGITGELIFTLSRTVGPGLHPKFGLRAYVMPGDYGVFAEQFTCRAVMNLDDLRSLNTKDEVSMVFQGWKSGDMVKVTGPIGWSVKSTEAVDLVETFSIELFLRDTVEGIVTKVDVQ